jgi:hypothetical protein
LQRLYQDLRAVDLYVGVLGEKDIKGSVVGEIAMTLIARQFKNIRNGDRLWYENAYPEEIIRQIKCTSFSDLIKRNIGIT